MRKKSYHPAYFGVFLALALILGYVESLIPFYFGIPGVKLGLTNLVIVLFLYSCGAGQALLLSCAKSSNNEKLRQVAKECNGKWF